MICKIIPIKHQKDIEKCFKNMSNKNNVIISGYLCVPELAIIDFKITRERILFKKGKSPNEETGNYAYHIIQSFPEGLDISDNEAHQCGLELCEKLRVHQAVICTHLHPKINNKGERFCKCKHNHILINSYIYQDMLDPEKPNVFKYKNCKQTYAQLRKWNDEIALSHNIPTATSSEAT